jgi:anti-sigma-K factor RskA
MKHDDPTLIDALAAEYVLGTLDGRARRRFERWRAQEWHVERRVQAWEERLAGLALRLTPMRPSPNVWAQIEKRIGAGAAPGTRTSRPDTTAQRRRSAWRALAAGVAIFVVLVGGYAAWRITRGPELEQLATITSPNATAPAWELQADADLRHLRAIARGGATPQTGKSFELWALPDNGGPPVSLGLMPESGRLDRELTDAQRMALQGASKVAVSLEPQGGSSTGAPTGPVLFVADRVKRA